MRMSVNESNVNEFLAACKSAAGEVWLRSVYGDNINLKSPMSPYFAIAALCSEHGDELELFCSDVKDSENFLQFFITEDK